MPSGSRVDDHGGALAHALDAGLAQRGFEPVGDQPRELDDLGVESIRPGARTSGCQRRRRLLDVGHAVGPAESP